MGRIRTRFIKNLGERLFEKYSERFTLNFEENKKIIKELVGLPSRKLRNVLAGYITSLKKREGKG